jgi:hypothetical protein
MTTANDFSRGVNPKHSNAYTDAERAYGRGSLLARDVDKIGRTAEAVFEWVAEAAEWLRRADYFNRRGWGGEDARAKADEAARNAFAVPGADTLTVSQKLAAVGWFSVDTPEKRELKARGKAYESLRDWAWTVLSRDRPAELRQIESRVAAAVFDSGVWPRSTGAYADARDALDRKVIRQALAFAGGVHEGLGRLAEA